MESICCFFIGHRDTPVDILPTLRTAIEKHITQYGVTEFLVGHYGAFDRMAAQCVINAKQTYPQIKLTLLLPYHPSERQVKLPEGFDGSCFPPGQESVPRQIAIVRANHYAVNHSDYLIAYVWQAGSNARNLLDYTRNTKRNCKILNLFSNQ